MKVIFLDWFFMPYHNVLIIAIFVWIVQLFLLLSPPLLGARAHCQHKAIGPRMRGPALKGTGSAQGEVCQSLPGFLSSDRPIPMNDSRGSSQVQRVRDLVFRLQVLESAQASRSHSSFYTSITERCSPRQIQVSPRYTPKSFRTTVPFKLDWGKECSFKVT